mgnify:FL=1
MNISSKENKKDADLALVRRAKRGDYGAFDLLVLKYQSRTIGLAMKFVQDTQLAEDISQEAFIKAYKSLKSFREESAFYTWLYRITANTAKNYLTSRKRRKEYLETDILPFDDENFEKFDIPGGDSPEDILAASNLRQVILESFSNLPQDIRTAISLREFEGLTYQEISEVTGCPIGTVRSRIFRGREEIQEKIAPLISHLKKEKTNRERRI